jgi:hypothetical protein
MKKLRDAQDGLRRFLDSVEILEPKLGPILFQLPPNWKIDPDRLGDFLKLLPRHRRHVFEFRDPTYEILAKHNCGYCMFDLAGYTSPIRNHCRFYLHPPARPGEQVSRQLFGCHSKEMGAENRTLEEQATSCLRLL